MKNIYRLGFFGLFGGFLGAQDIWANSLKFWLIYGSVVIVAAIMEIIAEKLNNN